jgi:hypothetical protein
MTNLKLGPIADDKPAKVSIELRATTCRSLNDYAQVHARENGLSEPLPIEKLIDPMLDRFMASDRGFKRLRQPQRR